MGKNKLSIVISKHFLIILFLIFYFVVISLKLISHPTPFYDWDESINAQVAKEIIERKSLVPLWQGKYWLDKPPLSFLFFGISMKLTPFLQPEISLRLTSLFLSIVALIFVYLVYLKVETSRRDVSTRIIAFLAVVITSFTPIFLQRSQILNLDVFLLIGWLGYLLFVQNFWLSLFFLSIAVLTKSLIGFYPAIIMLTYNLIILWVLRRRGSRQRAVEGYRIRSEHWREGIRNRTHKIILQILILTSWYVMMLIIFGKDFWQQHIFETHFRRVTASLESHFGQRTYYLDLIFEQFGKFAWLSFLGLGLVILSAAKNLSIYLSKSRIRERSFVANASQDEKLLYSLFLFPWFLFLNLTKTKIFWYLYPAIPQFAFLAVYPLTLLNRHSGEERSDDSRIVVNNNDSGQTGMTKKKIIYYFLDILIILYIFYQNFIKINFFTTFYSRPEDYYRLAIYAKDKCDSLTALVSKETRQATKTLENLGLTITSTKQWGDHPSIVFYFGKKVDFIYDKNVLDKKLSKNNCFAIKEDDIDFDMASNYYKEVKKFDSYYLLK